MSQSDGFLRRGQFSLAWFNDFQPIVVSVIGPVSHGKTSVLRTLLADDKIGSVGPGPTTMQPERQKQFMGNSEYLRIHDTPGWEWSATVASKVEKQFGDDYGISEICSVVEKLGSQARKDKRAWDQVKDSHVSLVVFNGKQDPDHYQDDIKLLSRCGIQKIAIVNFTKNDEGQDNSLVERWQQVLRNRAIDTVIEYDAHKRHFENEIELFRQIATKVEPGKAREVLDQIVENRLDKENSRIEEATGLIVKYLTEVVSVRKDVIIKLEKREKEEDDLRAWLLEEVVFSEIEAHKQLVRAWGFEAEIIGDVAGVRHCDKAGEISPGEYRFVNRIRKFLGDCRLTVRGTGAMGIASLTRLVDTVRQVRRRGKALEKKTITIEEKPANLSKVAKLWSGLLDEVGDRKKGKAARSQLTEWVREQIHED